ncbi:MAG: acyl-CoA thioester hydrolase [Gammaproteobacteria bacterium]|jgi:acyl-CoA thioester hydrolase
MSILQLHSEPLQDSWLDAYGHLNEAYYLIPMSNATWGMQDYFGIGVDYFKKTGCAIYTVETHLRYLNDVRSPADMVVETLMLGLTAKKIWFAHQMKVGDTICATAEFMTLHYNTRENRTAEMSEAICQKISDQIVDHPDWVGGQISLVRKK